MPAHGMLTPFVFMDHNEAQTFTINSCSPNEISRRLTINTYAPLLALMTGF